MFSGGKIGAFNLSRLPFIASGLLPEVSLYKGNIINNGGTISDNSLQAIANFVQTLKLNNIWDKFLEIAPYAGNDLNAALVKLKYPTGVQSTLTNVGFISANYSETTGLVGDTSGTKYLKTGFIPSVQLISSLDAHLSIYARNLIALSGAGGSPPFRYLGVLSNGNAYISRESLTVVRGNLGSTDMIINFTSAGILPGQLTISSVSTNLGYLFYNGSQVGIDTAFTLNTRSNREIYIFGNNTNDLAVQNSSNLICGFHTFGYGLTPAQALTFYNATQALQTALGRQV